MYKELYIPKTSNVSQRIKKVIKRKLNMKTSNILKQFKYSQKLLKMDCVKITAI